MSIEFDLPPAVKELTAARKPLQDHYGHIGMPFRFDGNLIGNIGEAIAAELFGINLALPNGTGIRQKGNSVTPYILMSAGLALVIWAVSAVVTVCQ